MPRAKVPRDQIKPGEVLCSYCTARCCRYFALPIATPRKWEDFDHIRWYLLHGNSAIFVDDGVWYLLVYGDCKHLGEDHRCGIYHERPSVCRAYSTDNCEYDGDTCYEKYFESAEQVWEYAEAVLPPRRRKRNQPVQLPVLGSVS